MHVYMVRQKSTGLYVGSHDSIWEFKDTAQMYFALTTAKGRLTRLSRITKAVYDKTHPNGYYRVPLYDLDDFEIIKMDLVQDNSFSL